MFTHRRSATIRAIFISYRRNDAEGEAGRLFDDLVREFGEQSVFMDVAGIQPGRDFRKVIDESIATCGVLLAVMGANWLDAKNENGERRLDDPSDFVRLETASALKRDIPVIPVLVRGSKMPRPAALPDELRDLAYRNAVELTHARWTGDLQFLIKALRPMVDISDKKSQQAEPLRLSQATPIRKVRGGGPVTETVLGAASAVPSIPTPSGVPYPMKFVLGGASVLILAGIFAYVLWPSGTSIPDVRGHTVEEAGVMLSAAGFSVGKTARRDDPTKDPNVVIEQSPSAGTKGTKGASVDLVLTPGLPSPKGAVMVHVPDVVGRTLAEARTQLDAAGFSVGKTARRDDPTKDPNVVIEQSPSAGTEGTKGASVDLVSTPGLPSPKPAAMVHVPDVVGRTLAEARTQLDVAGLMVGNTTAQIRDGASQGTVLSQSLKPGQDVKKGSAVDLTYSEPIPLVQVPNVVGMTLTQAQTELRNRGLSIANTRKQEQEGVASGTVLTQSPSAGERVQRRFGVALVLAESGRAGTSGQPMAVFDTTAGKMHCILFPEKAPIGVANFIGLASGTKDWTSPVTHAKKHGEPLYDGTIFHRVIPRFMIQGGDPEGTGTGDPGYKFKNETSPDLTFDRPGRLAYANAGRDTNGSQFFITEVPYPSLNGGYTIFGQCDDASVELVKRIARMASDPRDNRPFSPVKINHITIEGGAAAAQK